MQDDFKLTTDQILNLQFDPKELKNIPQEQFDTLIMDPVWDKNVTFFNHFIIFSELLSKIGLKQITGPQQKALQSILKKLSSDALNKYANNNFKNIMNLGDTELVLILKRLNSTTVNSCFQCFDNIIKIAEIRNSDIILSFLGKASPKILNSFLQNENSWVNLTKAIDKNRSIMGMQKKPLLDILTALKNILTHQDPLTESPIPILNLFEKFPIDGFYPEWKKLFENILELIRTKYNDRYTLVELKKRVSFLHGLFTIKHCLNLKTNISEISIRYSVRDSFILFPPYAVIDELTPEECLFAGENLFSPISRMKDLAINNNADQFHKIRSWVYGMQYLMYSFQRGNLNAIAEINNRCSGHRSILDESKDIDRQSLAEELKTFSLDDRLNSYFDDIKSAILKQTRSNFLNAQNIPKSIIEILKIKPLNRERLLANLQLCLKDEKQMQNLKHDSISLMDELHSVLSVENTLLLLKNALNLDSSSSSSLYHHHHLLLLLPQQ